MSSGHLIFVSAGLLRPKKADVAYHRRHFYVNYGLIGLATHLSEGDRSRAFVVHGRFEDPSAFVRRLPFSVSRRDLILLSIPSAQAIAWALAFAQALHAHAPRSRLVVGGRWTVPSILDGSIDGFGTDTSLVTGFGEDSLTSIVHDFDRGALLPIYNPLETVRRPFGLLDYGLCADREQLTPSLEVARGCGLGCAFCAERNVALTALKLPKNIAKEIDTYQNLFQRKTLRMYFECSMFAPSSAWTESFSREFRGRTDIEWRTETRVDVLDTSKVAKLARSGLKILDVGLESASERQLIRMNKTPNPKVYLKKASDLLKICQNEGVATKVNILLWAGETRSTIAETCEWLERHRDCILGISAGPVIGYGTWAERAHFRTELLALGARPTSASDGRAWDEYDLSDEFSSEDADALSRQISRNFMSYSDYFYLKSFSYFDTDYSLADFKNDIAAIEPEMLQFRV